VREGVRVRNDGRLEEVSGGHVRLYWGEQKIRDLRRLFPVTKNEDLAVRFGCSPRTLCRRAKALGLQKDLEWVKRIQDENFKEARFVLKVTKAGGVANFGRNNMAYLTKEERSANIRKGWETRRKRQHEKEGTCDSR